MRVIIQVILYLLGFLEIAILARCVLSFIPGMRDNRVIKYVIWLTEPVLSPVRNLLGRIIPSDRQFFDLSPIAAFFIIMILRSFLQSFI